ncbi:GNAT family N-acetyltransferase [Pelagibacterium limicola]|uniref:GNAT family N-acetyltransferase n=1 Tax=Pelagibacterium limicola TaxID=2791022 RepID=UPI0018AF5F7A|nr:GNAT family N-acetyltransferase [Pelagibacterium limicola]
MVRELQTAQPAAVSIRAATRADLGALCALWRQFNAWLDTLGEPENIDPALFGDFEALCFGPEAVCEAAIAFSGDEPIGYLVYYFGIRMEQVGAALYIADLFVSHEARGLGAGRALMEHARSLALARGCKSMLWQVWNRNATALAFYRALGADWIEEELTMIWRLG